MAGFCAKIKVRATKFVTSPSRESLKHVIKQALEV